MKILILSYKFAPEDGVGGRRWRLFSKELSRLGHQITVLTASSGSFKCNDSSEVDVVVLEDAQVNGKTAGLRKRWFHWSQVLGFNIDIDPQEKWIKAHYPTVKQLIIDQEIQCLIASGHPCSLNYYAAIIKSELPNLKLIQDFRDLWSQEKNYIFDIKKYSFRSKERALEAEQVAIRYADRIFNVSKEQANIMLQPFPQYKDKFCVIHNGYMPLPDPEATLDSTYNGAKSKKLRIVHAGTIRWGGYSGLEELLSALQLLPESQLDIQFFGTRFPKYILERYDSVIKRYCKINEYIDHENLVAEIKGSDLGLVIFDKSSGLGTKIFDYMAADSRIAVIAPDGELRRFCAENGVLSCGFDKEEIQSLINELMFLDVCSSFNDDVKNRFSISSITYDIQEALLELGQQ